MNMPIMSPHADQILTALEYQGSRNDCGPYTVTTVLNGLRHLELEPDKVAETMNRPRWRGPIPVIRRVPNWATFPWGMVDVFREFGLAARWRFFSTPENVRQRLDHGQILMPVIGEYRPLWAHVMTLVAWSPSKGWGFANTQYQHHNISWVSDEIFMQRWKRYARILVYIENF